jgi:hypothetical protein
MKFLIDAQPLAARVGARPEIPEIQLDQIPLAA